MRLYGIGWRKKLRRMGACAEGVRWAANFSSAHEAWRCSQLPEEYRWWVLDMMYTHLWMTHPRAKDRQQLFKPWVACADDVFTRCIKRRVDRYVRSAAGYPLGAALAAAALQRRDKYLFNDFAAALRHGSLYGVRTARIVLKHFPTPDSLGSLPAWARQRRRVWSDRSLSWE